MTGADDGLPYCRADDGPSPCRRMMALQRLLDEARAEIARLRAPASGDLVERARAAIENPSGTGQGELVEQVATTELLARIATFAATIQREATIAAHRSIEPAWQDMHTAFRMIRDAVEELGPVAAVPSRDVGPPNPIGDAEDIIAGINAIQREAREAAIEEAAQRVDHIMDHGTKLGSRIRALADAAPQSELEREAKVFDDNIDTQFARFEEAVKFEEGAAPQSGWRPIDSAPTDGTFILLGAPSGYTTTPMRAHVGRWATTYDVDRWITHSNDDFTDDGCPPTHWMPLPAPPTEDATG